MNYLILDENDIALNIILEAPDWELPQGQRLVSYGGPFYQGGHYNGTVVSNPDEVSAVTKL